MIISFLACGGVSIGSVMQTAGPNFVIVLSDDQGYYSTGLSNLKLKTPFLNALAEDGLYLNEFYTYKYCSPSR